MNISRDEFVIKLREQNVGASIHYHPLHYMPLYGYKGSKLTRTEKIASSILTLPISASMTLEDAEYAAEKFKKIYNSHLINRLVKVTK
jgi:dTDP-4-amino-4,6-dideoxygalactose transaminase